MDHEIFLHPIKNISSVIKFLAKTFRRKRSGDTVAIVTALAGCLLNNLSRSSQKKTLHMNKYLSGSWLSDTRKLFLSPTSSNLSKINNYCKWCVYYIFYYVLTSQSGFKPASSFPYALMDVFLSLWACYFASCNTHPYLASSLACSQDKYINHQEAGVHWSTHTDGVWTSPLYF